MSRKPSLTHFLCLPLVTSSSKPQFQASLSRFTASLISLDNESSNQIPLKAIRPLGTLHLTLGVMSLQTPERLGAALSFLRNLNVSKMLQKADLQSKATGLDPIAINQTNEPSGPTTDNVTLSSAAPLAPQTPYSVPPSTPQLGQEITAKLIDSPRSSDSVPKALTQTPSISPRPISPLVVTISTLHPMQSVSSTSIIYTVPHDPTSRLYPFCLALRDTFTAAGFLVPEKRPLKLHVTVANTIYAGGRGKKGKGKAGKEMGKFDVRNIIEREGEIVWAENVRLEMVAICEMGAKEVGEGEGEVEYTKIESVLLP